ncbi:hypothetical protein KAX17_18180 [Candidatus Bipolaricaulota bacterium]|nr:hypothetical protein [Candidatus Bipolaricaulota bacterium]
MSKRAIFVSVTLLVTVMMFLGCGRPKPETIGARALQKRAEEHMHEVIASADGHARMKWIKPSLQSEGLDATGVRPTLRGEKENDYSDYRYILWTCAYKIPELQVYGMYSGFALVHPKKGSAVIVSLDHDGALGECEVINRKREFFYE